MRVTTLIKKLFGKDSISDYMEVLDDDEKKSVLEYYSIQMDEDASEPDYFVKYWQDGLYTVKDINGNVIVHTYNVRLLKEKLKVLANKSKV
ncbi:hypothetical protein pEaSNUABM50_00038 [Erwinia phage pEa_SNUABM_50]|uniref:Uncharacterized protein n=3 Tax=Eneladusvirus BF TaxID=2560751 RepID=A0A7L8ZPC8_9CAUD|nr:hypothetical protein FDH34_gp040 [Serratia phage BF]AQW88565.1 hypothetical protein BF_0040 [Serratia phage BF]QOI70978.1 hypothetical protein pEaSNUABM12_00040 [Erwinia phage pEa_SNUABM_12]QOI72062.1 hypothetical protein pEaSNUABM50_00038 [Erwinia phage pEa_SNUABM_50]QXO11187.1 hypothetical protein pEaSNUABM19_00041 [Erwinia phage pEa_SNUABM_19]